MIHHPHVRVAAIGVAALGVASGTVALSAMPVWAAASVAGCAGMVTLGGLAWFASKVLGGARRFGTPDADHRVVVTHANEGGFLPKPSAAVERLSGIPGYSVDDAWRAVLTAHRMSERLSKAASELPQGPCTLTASRLAAAFREVVDVVASRPALLPRVQHFIDIYLQGAVEAVEGYRVGCRNGIAPDLERSFSATLERLLELGREQKRIIDAQGEETLRLDIAVLERRMDIDAGRLPRS